MGGHTKAQQYGLSLVISTEEAASVSDSVPTEIDDELPTKTASYEPITLLCEPGKSIVAEARRLQDQHFADATCKIVLSGNVVVYSKQKVDPNIAARPGAHHKWTIGIQTVMADLQRFAALDDVNIISLQDKARIKNALQGFTIDSAIVSFILPPCEKRTQDRVEERVNEAPVDAVKTTSSVQQHSSFMTRFGFRGTQGKGVPTPVTTVEEVSESANIVGMGGSST